MRAWLLTATDCSCTSLDVCALFDRDDAQATPAGSAEPLRVTRVAATSRIVSDGCSAPG